MQIGKKDEVIPAVIYKTDDMTVLKAVLEPALDFHNCSNSVPSYAVSSTLLLMNALQHTVLLVHMLFLLVIALRRKCVCFTSLCLLSCWGEIARLTCSPLQDPRSCFQQLMGIQVKMEKAHHYSLHSAM